MMYAECEACVSYGPLHNQFKVNSLWMDEQTNNKDKMKKTTFKPAHVLRSTGDTSDPGGANS